MRTVLIDKGRQVQNHRLHPQVKAHRSGQALMEAGPRGGLSVNCTGRTTGHLRQREGSSACSLGSPERLHAIFGGQAFFSVSVWTLEIFTAKQIIVLGGNKIAILLVFVVPVLMSQGQKILIFMQHIKNMGPYCFSFFLFGD